MLYAYIFSIEFSSAQPLIKVFASPNHQLYVHKQKNLGEGWTKGCLYNHSIVYGGNNQYMDTKDVRLLHSLDTGMMNSDWLTFSGNFRFVQIPTIYIIFAS